MNEEYSSTRMVAGLQILSSGFSGLHSVKFITLQYGEIPYVGGPLGPVKVKEACHTRNYLISLRYCINGLHLTTYLGFKFSTNIADSNTRHDNEQAQREALFIADSVQRLVRRSSSVICLSLLR